MGWTLSTNSRHNRRSGLNEILFGNFFGSRVSAIAISLPFSLATSSVFGGSPERITLIKVMFTDDNARSTLTYFLYSQL